MSGHAWFVLGWLIGTVPALTAVLFYWPAPQRRRLPAATRRAIRRERVASRLELPRPHLPYLYTDDPRDAEDTAP